MAMLEVKNLKVHYGVIQAIKGISFEVNEGEVIALIGANGAGKSSFGRDLLERYAGQAKRISGIHALFISDDESKLSASNEFARLQSMIKERLFMPRISEYEKLILQLQSEEFEAAVNFKEACKTNNEVDPPITKIDIIQDRKSVV